MMGIENMSNSALVVTTGLPGYYTLTEAAQELGYLSTSNIRADCGSGKIKAYKVGKTWLIPEDWVKNEKLKEASPIGNRGQARK